MWETTLLKITPAIITEAHGLISAISLFPLQQKPSNSPPIVAGCCSGSSSAACFLLNFFQLCKPQDKEEGEELSKAMCHSAAELLSKGDINKENWRLVA